MPLSRSRLAFAVALSLAVSTAGFAATPAKPAAQPNTDKQDLTAQPAMGHNAPTAELSPEEKAARDKRLQWFKDAKFGMFIHWGLYSQLAGEYKGQLSSDAH